MAEGTIKRLTDKGFGFIDTGGPKDLFFHCTNVEGASYDELQEGQKSLTLKVAVPKDLVPKT